MRFTIPEILKAVSEAKTHEHKVSILQNCGTETLEQILQYNFHPDIKFNLPEGDAPYKKEADIPVGKSATNLYREARRLYIFLHGYAPNLKPYRKEQLFIELLEGIHWTEADLLIAVKDKRLQDLYPGVTYECARDAFDRLLPQEPPKKIAKAVKLAIPDLDAELAKEKVEQESLPLAQPVSSTPTIVASVSDTVTPKKKGAPPPRYATEEERIAARKETIRKSKAKQREKKKAEKQASKAE
jgi:hypothetical protein